MKTDWRNYLLSQPKGSLPVGPMALLVHIASVWVPFTSESKEAVAHYPEIIREIQLAAQECGRKLASHIRKQKHADYQAQRRSIFELYIEEVAQALGKITGKSPRPSSVSSSRCREGHRRRSGGPGRGARGSERERRPPEAPLGRGGGVGHGPHRRGRQEDHPEDREARGDRPAEREGWAEPLRRIPIRSLANVQFNTQQPAHRAQDQKQKRYFFNVSMAKKFMQTFLVSEACKELIESRQDDQHPRPLLHDEAHHRGDEAEHLRGAGGVGPHHRGPRGGHRRPARGAAPLRHRARVAWWAR